MPIATRPGETFRFSLRKDRDFYTDAAQRPYFEFRSLSCGQCRRIDRCIDDPKGYAAAGDVQEAIVSLVKEHIVGWGNMTAGRDIRLAGDATLPAGQEIPFDPAMIEHLVTIAELWELLMGLGAQGFEADDRKN